MNIPKLIRAVQKTTSLSINKLADEVGISRRMMRYYLSGERNPREPIIKLLEMMARQK